MILLQLFSSFFLIGAFTFGGGSGMIALIRETVLANGWLTETEFLNFIAVSESTPGPLAVNIATFVGSSQAGFAGALCATLGVVLPSFVIILVIAALLKNLMRYAGVQAFLRGVQPCAVAMILATALLMALETLFGFRSFAGGAAPDWRCVGLFAGLFALHILWKRLRKTAPPPVAMLLLSAAAGILIFG